MRRQGEMVLGAELSAPAAARAVIREALIAADVEPVTVDDAVLLTSEIVANAVEHARTDICLQFRIAEDIRISVSDSSTRELVMRPQGPMTDRGRGLLLVDVIADSWGVEPTSGGKTVFFRLRLRSLAGLVHGPEPA